jgi:hypothetical protein
MGGGIWGRAVAGIGGKSVEEGLRGDYGRDAIRTKTLADEYYQGVEDDDPVLRLHHG